MSTGESIPEADSQSGLSTGETKDAAKPVSPEVDATPEKVEVKEKAPESAKESEGGKEPMQKLKSTVIVSAVLMAAAGAIIALAKKIREK